MNPEGFIHLRSLYSQSDLHDAITTSLFGFNERVVLTPCCPYLKLFEHAEIKDAIKEILSTTDYHLTTFSSNTLFKGKDTRGYHVDWPYHKYNSDANDLNIIYPGTGIEGVQCILPLDDFTIENGATMYIPFSHLARRYPTVEILRTGSFTTVNQERYPCKKKYFIANVGDVVLYPATLWHSAGLNTTTRPRRSLLASYSPSHVSKKDFGI